MYKMKRENRGKPKKKVKKLKPRKFGEKSIITLHKRMDKAEVNWVRKTELDLVHSLTAQIEAPKVAT